MFSSLYTANAVTYYDDEYKFLSTTDQWSQVKGYEKNSYYSASQSIIEVVDYTNDNITYSKTSSSGISITVYNYTMHEYTTLFGPIGFDFINANQMAYYYDLWINQENLTSAYAQLIGGGYSVDDRIAEDYVFKANLSIYLENQRADLYYDQSETEIIDIVDNFLVSWQIFVSYDSKGVLLNWTEILTIDGELVQIERAYSKQRVDDFSISESTDETPFTSFLIVAISLSVFTRMSKRKLLKTDR